MIHAQFHVARHCAAKFLLQNRKIRDHSAARVSTGGQSENPAADTPISGVLAIPEYLGTEVAGGWAFAQIVSPLCGLAVIG
jgi:hypothetical protein